VNSVAGSRERMGGRSPTVHAELVEDRSQMGVHGKFTQHRSAISALVRPSTAKIQAAPDAASTAPSLGTFGLTRAPGGLLHERRPHEW
jgi:hypothetical protein